VEDNDDLVIRGEEGDVVQAPGGAGDGDAPGARDHEPGEVAESEVGRLEQDFLGGGVH